MRNRVLANWSGGITSALACKWAIDTYKDVRIVFIDTFNEHPDTYRFLKDCEKIYGQEIEIASNKNYSSIFQVWRKFLGMNFANGAICSSELKREVRKQIQDLSKEHTQIFGFDVSERDRLANMRKNYPEINATAPLITERISKETAAFWVSEWGIELPIPYLLGYRNNNCYQTGCVRGGVGYWQKRKRDNAPGFDMMADLEHELTEEKGQAVTVLRVVVDGIVFPCFLKKHPNHLYYLDMAKGREPKPLFECHGLCSTTTIDSSLNFETQTLIEEL